MNTYVQAEPHILDALLCSFFLTLSGPLSPVRRRRSAVYAYSDLRKQLVAALLWCVDFTAGPTGRPLASSPRAAALSFVRHLGRPLRAANTDPRVLCFSMQPAHQVQSAVALCLTCNVWECHRWCRFSTCVWEFLLLHLKHIRSWPKWLVAVISLLSTWTLHLFFLYFSLYFLFETYILYVL